MKKQILVILIFFFSINIYGKSVTVRYTIENVTIHISSFSYREEINKGIIISEYVKNLSRKYNYNDSIKIFLEMIPDEQAEYFLGVKRIFFYKLNLIDLIY